MTQNLTKNEEQALSNVFESILTDSDALTNALHNEEPDEVQEMLLSEYENQGFPKELDVRNLERYSTIKMWSGIPTSQWIEEYSDYHDDLESMQPVTNTNDVTLFILDNLHNVEFEINVDITPDEYLDQFPTDNPSKLEAEIENYNSQLIIQVLNDVHYDEQVVPLVRESIVEQGYDVERLNDPDFDYGVSIFDVQLNNTPQGVALDLSVDAETYGSVTKYINDEVYIHDLIEKEMITFDVLVLVRGEEDNMVNLNISSKAYELIKTNFDDAFNDKAQLDHKLQIFDIHFYQIITAEALNEQGFPDKANYQNVDVFVDMTSKIDNEMWAEQFIVMNDLENAEDSEVINKANDFESIYETILSDLQQTDIAVIVNTDLETWRNEEYQEELSQFFAEDVFEMDMIDEDLNLITDTIKEELSDTIKDVKREIGTNAFAPDDPSYDVDVDDDYLWDMRIVKPNSTSSIEAFIRQAIQQEGITNEDELISKLDEGWYEDKLVEGDFLSVDESPVSSDYTLVIEMADIEDSDL